MSQWYFRLRLHLSLIDVRVFFLGSEFVSVQVRRRNYPSCCGERHVVANFDIRNMRRNRCVYVCLSESWMSIVVFLIGCVFYFVLGSRCASPVPLYQALCPLLLPSVACLPCIVFPTSREEAGSCVTVSGIVRLLCWCDLVTAGRPLIGLQLQGLYRLPPSQAALIIMRITKRIFPL